MDIPTVVDASWAGVIVGILGLVAALLSRRWGRSDTRDADLRRAAKEWRLAVRRGDDEAASMWKRRYDVLRGGLAVALACLCLSGCTTRAVPPAVIGRHILHPAPGDVVPPLPDGESIWTLATPRGLEAMLPGDFPAEEGDAK